MKSTAFRFSDPTACRQCGGKGTIWERVANGIGFSEKKCPVCRGTGNLTVKAEMREL